MQTVESFAQFTGLGVSEPNLIADPECCRGLTLQRRLDLAGTLGSKQPKLSRHPRLRFSRPARWSGSDVAAGIHDCVSRARLTHHGADEVRRRRRWEAAIVIKQGGAVEAGAGSELGQLVITGDDMQAAGAATIDQLQIARLRTAAITSRRRARSSRADRRFTVRTAGELSGRPAICAS